MYMVRSNFEKRRKPCQILAKKPPKIHFNILQVINDLKDVNNILSKINLSFFAVEKLLRY